MTGELIEVADIVRQYGEAFLARYAWRTSWHQRRVLIDIARCRTAAQGGHTLVCTDCGLVQNAYNSCRNRHCPKCLGSARRRWTQAREVELLPVPYFHVVFTLPHLLAPLAASHPRVVYGILFKAAAQTLLEVAADPRHLGARIGFLAVLHTWGQKLNHHPHLHCVVPGGGLSPHGARWIPARERFFLPVRVLSRLFRSKCLAMLWRAFAASQLPCTGQMARHRTPLGFKRLLAHARRQEWVVYAKRPFGGPTQVVRYLARYTHRVAIANQRIVRLADGRVTFRYKDYADGHATKLLTLPAVEFIRRFLVHVLPPGFIRIRHYGILANHDRTGHIALCRQRIAEAGIQAPPPEDLPEEAAADTPEPVDPDHCPACRGDMTLLRTYPRPFLQPQIRAQPALIWNTS